MNFKSIGIPTIKLLVIAAVITILLFLTNNTTEAKIAQNQADANVASRKEVLPDADDFDEKTVTVDGVEYTYYEAKNGAGYVESLGRFTRLGNCKRGACGIGWHRT